MTTDPPDLASQKIPDISAPMACIGLTACERTFVLNMCTLKQTLIGRAQDCEDATWQRASSGFEPMLSYSAEILRIYQAAIAEVIDLLTAQSHGEQHKVDVLIERIRAQAAKARQTGTEVADQ